MIRFRFIIPTIGFFLSLCSPEKLPAQQTVSDQTTQTIRTLSTLFPVPTYDLLRDTLFLLDSVYLEVRLDKQIILKHVRGEQTKQFPCSTGNPRLPEAIATREGIFSVQWKSQRYMSRQFGVWLNYWMPFDGGIGFHGLDGRSYYKYLGRRPSSHGCVRISNETGRDLFATIPRGTVVYVHSGAPARVLHFADSNDRNLRIVGVEDAELLRQRLDAVIRSSAGNVSLREHLALPSGEKPLGGIDVGRANGSMRVQYTLQPKRLSLLEEPSYSVQKPEPAAQLPPLSMVENTEHPDVQPQE